MASIPLRIIDCFHPKIARRDKQRRDGSGKTLASVAENPLQFLPKTPEVMSPEARTAQWVLNSDPPNSSEGGKEEAVMSSKDVSWF